MILAQLDNTGFDPVWNVLLDISTFGVTNFINRKTVKLFNQRIVKSKVTEVPQVHYQG